MAYLDHVGSIFFGVNRHSYSAADVYAFQIVGSTDKSPICRAVPLVMNAAYFPMGGSWVAQIDAAWLARNRLPEEPLRKAAGEFRAYRIHTDSVKDHPRIIVPKTRIAHSRHAVSLKLFTCEEAIAKREEGTFCEY